MSTRNWYHLGKIRWSTYWHCIEIRFNLSQEQIRLYYFSFRSHWLVTLVLMDCPWKYVFLCGWFTAAKFHRMMGINRNQHLLEFWWILERCPLFFEVLFSSYRHTQDKKMEKISENWRILAKIEDIIIINKMEDIFCIFRAEIPSYLIINFYIVESYSNLREFFVEKCPRFSSNPYPPPP